MIQKHSIDKDEEFEVVLRKQDVETLYCGKGFHFQNKTTKKNFGRVVYLKGYTLDEKGDPLSTPEKESMDDYEVIPNDR